ncbi:MAG TPA: GGDEF domain-containing protein [Spirochaetia bacterium]|nr:GGDEF domain-containing protein [Spirochaetia bacterium]
MGNRPRRAALYAGVLLLLVLVGYLDYITGPEISMSLFYFAPIMLGGWFFYRPRTSAILVPILAAGTWLAADLLGGAPTAGTWIEYWNALIRLGMFLVVSIMISRLREANAREQVLSRTDALTGVFNSRYFQELVHAEIVRATRYSEPFSFVYFDLDNFKAVNDTLGHDQGDALLRAVTANVRAHIRETDVMARIGGDEFAILFPRTDSDHCRAIVDKVVSVISTEIGSRWPVTLSAGALTFRRPPASWDEVVKAADVLMYRAKNGGKDRVAFESVG